MSIDSAISIAWDVLKWVVVPIKRQFRYVMSSNTYAQDLRKEVSKLEYDTERIHNVTEEARNNLRIVYSQVTEWQKSAAKALKEAEDLLGDFEKASKSCCYGTLPDPNYRYQFSRKAEDKKEDIQRLARECSEFKDLCFRNPAPGNIVAPTPARGEGKEVVQSTTTMDSTSSASVTIKLRDEGVFKSRASMIQDIMDALADDHCSVVGVHGMGGVGKSTLLADAKERIREKNSFHWVAKADVSQNPDIKAIQGEIADALGLSDIKDKESLSGRAELLQRRLENEEKEKKKVLIILDNLWKGLDLKSVGIPCGHDNKVIGCKLLLTSRFQRVLQVEMGCDRDFLLDELQEEEAKKLFERIVGDKVHVDKFKPLVAEALCKCAGLPFLIVNLAKRLKHAGLPEWKNALKQIGLSKNEGLGEMINNMLQSSYDHLKEAEKSLLALCVACGTSKPSLENLVRYSVGCGLFQEDNMEEARDSLRSLIRTLQASSFLLEDGDDYGFKIHDLIREFVASVASRDHPLLVLKDQDKLIIELPNDKLKSCGSICFPYTNMKKLPQELDCPELRIFLLFTNNRSIEVPDSLFKSMRKLMVLNLTGIHLTCSPSPFQFLKNLYTLCLDNCLIDNVSILGELKRLQILSFVNSKIQRLPKEIGQLVELRLLDLNYCSKLQIIEPGVLGSLIKLEELYMKDSFKQWNVVGQTPPTNANLIELNNMKNLCTLYASILNPSVIPEDLNIKKLTKSRIQIGELWNWSSDQGLNILALKFVLESDIFRKACIQSILGKADNLFLDGLDGIEQSICALSQKAFLKLKHLHIQNSPSVHYILHSPSHTDFKTLESLFLLNLTNLKKICTNNISSKPFSALKVVRVKYCHKMEVLFPLSSVRELPQLKEIEVVNCKLMQGIVEADESGKFEMRNMHVLKLFSLPHIKKFFTAKSTPLSSTSDNLVGAQIAFFNGQQVAFQILEKLEIIGLDSLEFIFLPSMVKSLTQLKELTISDCEKMEAIIMEEERFGMETSEILAFPMLIDLCLKRLKSLRCFSGGKCARESRGQDRVKSRATTLFNHEVTFQILEKLEIIGLDSLESIFLPSMVKSLTQLKELTISDCEKMEAIIMEEEGFGMETSEILAFPMLIVLRLKQLKSLRCFSGGKCARESRSQDSVKSRATTPFNHEVAFQILEKLEIIGLDSLEFIFLPSMVKSLTQLKELTISDCEKMEAIIMKEERFGMETSEILAFPMLIDLRLKQLKSLRCFSGGKCARESRSQDRVKSRATTLFNHEVAFPNLKAFFIKGMANIEMIWHDQIPADSFSKLKFLSVKKCKKLVNIVPSFILGRLLSLNTLMAKACDSLEVVFKLQPPYHLDRNSVACSPLEKLQLTDLSKLNSVWDKELHRHIKFQCLRWFTLQRCARLTSLFSDSIARDLIQLEDLKINQCSIVEHIEKEGLGELSINVAAIEGPSHELKVASSFPSYFQHMKTLDVSLCDGLSNMFTPTIAENLLGLTKLRISNCEILTEVITDEGGREGHVVTFNQLKYMELDGLTRLRCFSSGGYTLMFPLLKDIIVNRCPKMKFFHEGRIEASKLERVQVRLNEGYVAKYQYFWKGNLNTTIQNMFEEMVVFAETKFMRLFEFSELIGKWHGELNPITSSWQLESLVVDKCPFIYAIPSSLMLVLKRMTRLQVHNCEPLEEIFNLEGLEAVGCTQALPQLQSLCLVNLPKLRQLWNRDLQGTMCFNSLQYLSLYKCSNLRHAFVLSMAQCLPNLQRIEIKECDQMEGVIIDEKGQGSAMEEITFPKLMSITLECLPNLTSFLSWKNHTLECPILSKLNIAHCPKMRSLTWQSSMEIDNGTPSLFTSQVQCPKLVHMFLYHMDNLSKIWSDGPQETLTYDNLQEVWVQNCRSLQNVFPHWVATSLTQLKELQVESCGIEEIVASGNETPHSNTTQDLFPKLTSLVLHDMPQLKNFCTNLPTLKWPFLKELRVTHCDKANMLSFVESMGNWAKKDYQRGLLDQEAHYLFERDFPNLERLLLVDNNIQMIQDGNFPDDMLSKLEALTLACFHDKKAAFPSIFLLERFQNLQSLEVFCSSFEDLFSDKGLVEERKHPVLKNLRELKLNKLHNLKCLWRKDSLVSKILQSIETFEVWDCPCLTTIFPTVTSFQKLTNLEVKNCSGLVHLVTASAVTNLVHLEWITIIECERMKEVVANDGNEEEKVIFFRNLTMLTLKYLPSLECFSSIPSCAFRFPYLWDIEVEECPKLKIFSKGTLSTPELDDVSLFRYKWEGNWEKSDDLNTTIQKLSA